MPLFRPGKPYRLLTSPSNSFVAGTRTKVTWGGSESDGTFGASTSSSQTEIALAGLYVVTYAMKRSTTASGRVIIELELNGVVVTYQVGENNTLAAGDSLSFIDQLSAGDVLAGWVTIGGAAPAVASPACRMAVVRIGPIRWT